MCAIMKHNTAATSPNKTPYTSHMTARHLFFAQALRIKMQGFVASASEEGNQNRTKFDSRDLTVSLPAQALHVTMQGFAALAGEEAYRSK